MPRLSFLSLYLWALSSQPLSAISLIPSMRTDTKGSAGEENFSHSPETCDARIRRELPQLLSAQWLNRVGSSGRRQEMLGKRGRPRSVVVLTTLMILSSLYALLVGGGAFIAGEAAFRLDPLKVLDRAFTFLFGTVEVAFEGGSVAFGRLPPLILLLACIFLVAGTVGVITSCALWRGKNWAWKTTLLLSAVYLVFCVIMFHMLTTTLWELRMLDFSGLLSWGSYIMVGVAVQVIALYCLFRPSVKAYLGK